MASSYFNLSANSGSGDSTLTVTTASENATGSQRTATITISDPNGNVDPVTVSVIQYSRPDFDLISGQSSSVPAAGGAANKRTAEVHSDYDWWLVASAADYSYIDVTDETSGDSVPFTEATAFSAGDYYIDFTFDANASTSTRSCGFALRYRRLDGSLGTIPVSSSTYAFTFTQAGVASYLTAAPTTIYLDDIASSDETVTITANVDYTITINDD